MSGKTADTLDKSQLESYLADEVGTRGAGGLHRPPLPPLQEFKEVMEMTKAEFYQLPLWIQNNKRREVKLF